MQIRRWHYYKSSSELAGDIASRIIQLANDCLEMKSTFHIVLAGGTTPKAIYSQLQSQHTDWNKWHIWFGDERCLPVGDAERNDSMAIEAWLDVISIPSSNIHAMPAELGAEQGSVVYQQALAEVDEFDLVLLGLGEDGHTASLFPDQDWGKEQSDPDVLAVFNAIKPPPERISMSARRLGKSQQVWFIVTGASKRDALQAWKAGRLIPAASIAPIDGVDIFTDQPEI